MAQTQGSSSKKSRFSGPFDLRTDRLGPLPLINHFLGRLQIHDLLESFVPTDDRRCAVSHAQCLGILLRSIIVEREPVYRQQETVLSFAPGLFGIDRQQVERLSDDRIGRALDRLYDADRGSLLTAVIVRMTKAFSLCMVNAISLIS